VGGSCVHGTSGEAENMAEHEQNRYDGLGNGDNNIDGRHCGGVHQGRAFFGGCWHRGEWVKEEMEFTIAVNKKGRGNRNVRTI